MEWGTYHPSKAIVGPQYKFYSYAFSCKCQDSVPATREKGWEAFCKGTHPYLLHSFVAHDVIYIYWRLGFKQMNK